MVQEIEEECKNYITCLETDGDHAAIRFCGGDFIGAKDML
mgnify:FL=1